MYYAKIVDAINPVEDFARDFFDKKLISRETRDAVLELTNVKTNAYRTQELMRAVGTVVRVQPDSLREVLSVLHCHITTKELAKEIAKQGINVNPKV